MSQTGTQPTAQPFRPSRGRKSTDKKTRKVTKMMMKGITERSPPPRPTYSGPPHTRPPSPKDGPPRLITRTRDIKLLDYLTSRLKTSLNYLRFARSTVRALRAKPNGPENWAPTPRTSRSTRSGNLLTRRSPTLRKRTDGTATSTAASTSTTATRMPLHGTAG